MFFSAFHYARLVSISLALHIQAVYANTDIPAGHTDLLARFNQQTDIATKTGLNIKYVPGIVDILYGSKLKKRGYQTVLEAITRLPGIQLLHSSYGANPNVRGSVSDTFQGDMQILVNGVSMVSGNDSQPFIALNMPLSIIDRIEIIKGPGSALYGEFAINGVINIVTVKDSEGGMLHLSGGSFDTHNASISQQWQGNDWQISAALTSRRTDGPEFEVPSDVLRNVSQILATNTPGKADTRSYFEGAVVQAKYADTTIDASYTKTLQGDQFGLLEWLTDDDEYRNELDVTSLQLSQVFESEQNGRFTLSAGIQRYDFERRYVILPQGIISEDTVVPFAPLSDDIFADQQAEIQRLQGKAQWLSGQPNGFFKRHRLLAELHIQNLDVIDATTQFNFDLMALAQGSVAVSPEPNTVSNFPGFLWRLDGVERNIYSLVLQDEFHWTDQTRVTFGARYDAYSSRDNAFSPRLSLLHSFADNQRLKLQLAQAFRPPTLNQESTNAALNNEESIVLDMSYAHEYSMVTLEHSAYINWVDEKITPYWALNGNQNLLEMIEDEIYRNNPERLRFYGFESSVKYEASSQLALEMDLAYTHGDGTPTQSTEFYISPWTIDVNATWAMTEYAELFLEQRFFSSRERRPDDSRQRFGSQSFTNLSLAIAPSGIDHCALIVSVENLFDNDVRAPAAWVTTFSYPDDFPVSKRRLNAALEYHW